jgi:multimeric flavodoxin WrbA
MLERIREGMATAGQVEWEEIFLNRTRFHDEAAERLAGANGLIFGYPLYIDTMPAVMLRFLEILYANSASVRVIRESGIRALFLIHSGFPDGVHTAHLEEIHRRLCETLGLEYAGTIRKPGSEGVRLMPPAMQKKLFSILRDAGEALAKRADFVPGTHDELVRHERFGIFQKALLRLGAAIGVTNMYWNKMLKQNGAWEKRFKAPYGMKYRP